MSTSTSGITEYARDGLTFDVTDRGDPAAPTVLLLHGFPEDRQSWDPVADRLVDAGTPDPGTGPARLQPARPARRAVPAGLRAHRAGRRRRSPCWTPPGIERVHLVGHDWGGGLAWMLAGAHPDRVATLTVLSTPHPAALRRAATSAPWQFAHSAYMLFFQVPRLPERVLLRRLEGSAALLRVCPGPRPSATPAGCANPAPSRGALGWYRAMRPLPRRGAPVPRPDDVRLGPPRRVPRATGGRVDRGDGPRRLPVRRGRRGPLAPGAASRTSAPPRSWLG